MGDIQPYPSMRTHILPPKRCKLDITQPLPPRRQCSIYLNRRMSCPVLRLAAIRDMIDFAHALVFSVVRFAEWIVAEQACFRRSVLLELRFA